MTEIGFQHGWLQRAVDAKEARGDFGVLAMKQKTQFKIIHNGTVFNKKFILTYNVAIVFVVLIFSLVHWLRKLDRLRRARRIKAKLLPPYSRARIQSPAISRTSSADTVSLLDESDDEYSPSSSKAVTLSDAPIVPVKKGDFANENAALLDKQSPLPSRSTARAWLSGFFMYQPRPIPFINKVLPDNGTSFFVLCLSGLNIFYSFYRCPMTIDLIYIWADRTGLVFVANLPLLYFLGAKNQPLKFLTGHSYEQLNIFHRRLGEILCLLAILHTCGMLTVWYTILRPYGWDLKFYLTSQIIVLGLGALLCYEALYFTSLSSFRQRWYEIFLVLHIIFQAAAMPLLWFHHHRCRTYVGVALAIFAIDRLVFRLTLKSKSIPASLNVLKDNETVIVTAQWPLPSTRWYRRALGLTASYKHGWKPTEHVFLTVPSLSRKHIIQAHPFTIASAAPTEGDTHADFRLLIRAYDGFTRDLVEYAKYKSGVATIRLDGPYGSQSAMSSLLDCDLAVVICGGSGIAVGYPLVCGLLARRGDKIEEDVEEIAAKGTLPEARICLIWVVHEEAHKSWMSEEDIEELRLQGVTVLIPQPTAVSGRPNVSQIMENWVGRRLADDDDEVEGGHRVGVVCSGPEGMTRAVRNRCAEMRRKGWDVEVDIEKYGW